MNNNFEEIIDLLFKPYINLIIWSLPFLVGMISLICGIYYSMKRGTKTIVIFLVVAFLFEIIRYLFVFDMPLLGSSSGEKPIANKNLESIETIIMTKSLIGMNSATAEAVVIIIGLIYILLGKFLIKSKIIISSILVITLAIVTLHWIGTFEWFNLINCTKTQYIKALKKAYERALENKCVHSTKK